MFVRGEDIHLQTLRRRRHGTWLQIRYMVGLQAALRARRIAAATYGQPTVLGTQSLRVNKLIRRVKEKCAADYSHTCVCVCVCVCCVAVCLMFRLPGDRQAQNINAARFYVLVVVFIKGFKSVAIKSRVHLETPSYNLHSFPQLCVKVFRFRE